MKRTLILLLTTLVVFSLTFAPANIVGAQQVIKQNLKADCPHFEPGLTHEQGFLQSLPPECTKAYQKSVKIAENEAGRHTASLPTTVGGPDAFGYTYNDSIGFSWISASTNSGLTEDDNYSGPANIGFNFPFYGFTQTQLYFSTNGLITFGQGYSWYNNGVTIPSIKTPNNFIAPFWDDLVVGPVYNVSNTGAIYYQQGGIAPNRYFVIEWRKVETYNASSPFSVEAILYENGDIVIQHQSLPASYYSTVGIENSLGDDGLEYQSGSSGLSAPKAIRFYYPTTPTARVLVSPLNAGNFSTPGGITNFTITVA